MTDHNLAVVDLLAAVGSEHDATVPQMALAWLLANPVVTAPIVGANSLEQLAALLPAADIELTAEEKSRLDEASAWQS